VPQLVALESSSIDFVNDLESLGKLFHADGIVHFVNATFLDRLSPRTADTVHVFYMKSGQKGPDEILNNVVIINFSIKDKS